MEYKTISYIHRNRKEIVFFFKEGETLSYENIVDVEIHQKNWIDVKKELPQIENVVLAITKDGDIYTARLSGKCLWWCSECECRDGSTIHDVTHWMPLPEPPKD